MFVVAVYSCSHAEKFKDWRGHDATNFYTCLAVATVSKVVHL